MIGNETYGGYSRNQLDYQAVIANPSSFELQDMNWVALTTVYQMLMQNQFMISFKNEKETAEEIKKSAKQRSL